MKLKVFKIGGLAKTVWSCTILHCSASSTVDVGMCGPRSPSQKGLAARGGFGKHLWPPAPSGSASAVGASLFKATFLGRPLCSDWLGPAGMKSQPFWQSARQPCRAAFSPGLNSGLLDVSSNVHYHSYFPSAQSLFLRPPF